MCSLTVVVNDGNGSHLGHKHDGDISGGEGEHGGEHLASLKQQVIDDFDHHRARQDGWTELKVHAGRSEVSLTSGCRGKKSLYVVLGP